MTKLQTLRGKYKKEYAIMSLWQHSKGYNLQVTIDLENTSTRAPIHNVNMNR